MLISPQRACRFEQRPSRHWTFRLGPGRRTIQQLEGLGFTQVAVLDEIAGGVRIPAVLLFSEDSTIRASVTVRSFLALGQFVASASFISQTEDGTVVHTGMGSVPSGQGLVAGAADSTEERLAQHRQSLESQPATAAPLDQTLDGMLALSHAFYERVLEIRRQPIPDNPGFRFVDGRAAARRAGLTVENPAIPKLTWRELAISTAVAIAALGLSYLLDLGFLGTFFLLLLASGWRFWLPTRE